MLVSFLPWFQRRVSVPLSGLPPRPPNEAWTFWCPRSFPRSGGFSLLDSSDGRGDHIRKRCRRNSIRLQGPTVGTWRKGRQRSGGDTHDICLHLIEQQNG